MECECEVSKKIYLSLSEPEAKWLKDYLQNQMVPDEDPKDGNMRSLFFNTLRKALDKPG